MDLTFKRESYKTKKAALIELAHERKRLLRQVKDDEKLCVI